jgi:hypothetical protein
MVLLSLDLSKAEIAMLIMCIDSAMNVVDFSEEEMESANRVKEDLSSYL